jgi:cytochrome c-type biogenesis protein CcmH/NrfG
MVALAQDRFADAARELLLQRRMDTDTPGMSLQLGIAYQHAGDWKHARYAYRWALRREPDNLEARDSLLAVSRRMGPP